MAGYEGLGELISNSVRYGLSNKRAIIIWGISMLIGMLIYFIGIIGSIFLKNEMLMLAIMLLSMLPLVAMSVLLFGYVRRMISGLLEGDDAMPDVMGFAGMAVDGIKMMIIYVEGVVIMFILFIPMVLVLMLPNESASMVGFCLLYPLIMVLCMVVLIVNLVQLAVFADTGSLLSGLNPLKAVRLIIGDLRYAAVAAITAVVLYMLLSVASMILMILIVTILLLPFVMVPAYAAFIYVLARFYQHAEGREPHVLPA